MNECNRNSGLQWEPARGGSPSRKQPGKHACFAQRFRVQAPAGLLLGAWCHEPVDMRAPVSRRPQPPRRRSAGLTQLGWGGPSSHGPSQAHWTLRRGPVASSPHPLSPVFWLLHACSQPQGHCPGASLITHFRQASAPPFSVTDSASFKDLF